MLNILSEQKGLLAQLTTVFGDCGIVLKSLIGREGLSELFEFKIIFSAQDDALDPEKALGSHINIAFQSESQERYIDGIVAEFSQGATANKNGAYLTEYGATIRPSFWLLTLDRNSLIFQNKTAIDILKQVLNDGGIKDLEDKTKSRGKTERTFCVQYNESSFNFASRIMEEEGIFYFFKHEKNKHILVMGDSASVHVKPSGESKVCFFQGGNDRIPLGKVFDTSMTATVNSGGYSTTDYNYTISQTDLFNKLESQWKGTMFYEFPGIFETLEEGKNLSKIRVESSEFRHQLLQAASTAPNLTPGVVFTIAGHHGSKFNADYVILDIEHIYNFSNSSGYTYKNKFRAFKKGTEFRPPRKTPRPLISGTQTAVVTGPSGEEICRNEHCCVKVHFHWDQNGKKDENDSCWVRVAQQLAGNGYGAGFLPRIGQEVVVSFMEGNPDRPLVVGCVYNDKFMPPYDDAMISWLKTVTFTDDKGFNEFRFNDEKDKEEIYIHAQKDFLIHAINSMKIEIEKMNYMLDLWEGSIAFTLQSKNGPADYTLSIKEGNSSVTLEKGDHSIIVKKGNSVITLDEGNHTITLGKGDLNYDVTGNHTLTVSGDITIKADGNISFKSGKDIILDADGNISLKSGKNITSKSGQDTTAEAGTAFALKSGTELTLKSGTDLKAESGTGMTLKAGVNLEGSAGMSMNLKANMGIALKANMNVECNGQLGVKVAGLQVEVAGQAMTKVSAPMIQVGGGMVQLG
ncbi:MAG: type VI secretion system tip protein VgrG [Holosporaceae bacterium]|jgi:type VI secretion system secreted protein VgrG|nr:type VI secretion system tip protein VgrG [Holosporaceae bacterium]